MRSHFPSQLQSPIQPKTIFRTCVENPLWEMPINSKLPQLRVHQKLNERVSIPKEHCEKERISKGRLTVQEEW